MEPGDEEGGPISAPAPKGGKRSATCAARPTHAVFSGFRVDAAVGVIGVTPRPMDGPRLLDQG